MLICQSILEDEMTIIKQLIKTLCNRNENFNKIINQCLKLKELNMYLYNLDVQAQLSEECGNNVQEIEIMEREATLLKILQSKILEIVLNSGMEQSEVLFNARIIKDDLDEADMVELETSQTIPAYKIYMIVKIIVDNLEVVNLQTKNSILVV